MGNTRCEDKRRRVWMLRSNVAFCLWRERVGWGYEGKWMGLVVERFRGVAMWDAGCGSVVAYFGWERFCDLMKVSEN
jgi:hypothetical protein